MQNRLHPIIQVLALLVIPVIVVYIINYILSMTGKIVDSTPLTETIRVLIFIIPNALFIILHKFRLPYVAFIIAAIATIVFVRSVPISEIEYLSPIFIYLIHFIYFSLFIGLTYFAYFRINSFKLKSVVFILGAIILHAILLTCILLLNKIPIDLKGIIHKSANLYLMIGLALAFGLLFFELPQALPEIGYDYGDDDDTNDEL